MTGVIGNEKRRPHLHPQFKIGDVVVFDYSNCDHEFRQGKIVAASCNKSGGWQYSIAVLEEYVNEPTTTPHIDQSRIKRKLN